ncbi:hypothetical protein EBZ80_11740 [bacterium]|nr:hypothetical protein [bacterium]
MFVCLCAGVNERCLRDLAEAGCHDWREAMEKTKAGKSCGSCRSHVQKVIQSSCSGPGSVPSQDR